VSKKIKVGVLGAGAWSVATHIPALLDNSDVELVVVTSQDVKKAQEIASLFGFEKYTADWKSSLNENALDLVIISSPPFAHEEMVLAALEAGCNVMCEKPFAIDYQSAQKMADKAKKKGKTITIGYGWPHTPIFNRFHELLQAQTIGSIEQVNLRITANIRDLLSGSSTLDWSDKNIISEKSTYTNPEISAGGAIATTLSHSFGLLFHFLKEDIKSVFGMSHPEGSNLDYHDAIVARSKSGAIVSICCSSTSANSTSVKWSLDFIGSKGEMFLDTDKAEITLESNQSGSKVEKFDIDGTKYTAKAPVNIALDLVRDRAVQAGSELMLAVKAVQLSDAILESFKTQKVVKLN
jgi:predicted dehydrogenase